MTEEPGQRCTHKGGCDDRGTFRVVILLSSDGNNPWTQRREFTHERRCAQHRTENAEVFLTGNIWRRLASEFEVRARAYAGFGVVPVRARTQVAYVEEGDDIEMIPIWIAKPDGSGEEKYGSIGVRRARI